VDVTALIWAAWMFRTAAASSRASAARTV
jgi:hypothetical protein